MNRLLRHANQRQGRDKPEGEPDEDERVAFHN